MNLEYNDINHEYKLDGMIIPSVTQVLKGAGLVNLDFVDEDLLEAKADLGKKVHLTIELNDMGTLDAESLHILLKKYLDSWIKFKHDFNYIPINVELQLFHPLFRYAGRIDQIGTMGEELTLVDIKSGTVQKSHAIQTAGYKSLYEINYKKKIKRRMAVYLSPENYKIEEHKDKNDISVFNAGLTIYNYKKTNHLK